MMFLYSQNDGSISHIVIYQSSQEIRLGDKDMIRALFERATSLSLAPKKMKVRVMPYSFTMYYLSLNF